MLMMPLMVTLMAADAAFDAERARLSHLLLADS